MPKSASNTLFHVDIPKLIRGIDNPYDGFQLLPAIDLQGWNSANPIFDFAIASTEPKLILEVGVWKGASTAYMTHVLKQQDIEDCHIVAIDTWLGGVEHWADDGWRGLLKQTHGMPRLYDIFLTNMIRLGLIGVVTPFPQTSSNAAEILRRWGCVADLVYVDGSHEYQDVKSDLSAYWQLLRPGGIIFGDDCTWPGVEKATQEFTRQHGLKLELYPNDEGEDTYWMVVKNES
jgi:SAM-dependent methyltransferase